MRPNEFKEQNKLNKRSTASGSELSATMAALIGTLLRKHGIPDQKADEIALESMGEMHRMYGGSQLYFSREDSFLTAAIHDEIFDRFYRNELSVTDLALQYGFSSAWVYTIIRRTRIRRKEERDAQASADLKDKQGRWKREN